MISIREAARQDIPSILVIQASAFQDPLWKEADYRRMLEDPGSLVLVAEDGPSAAAAGYSTARVAGGEAEILHLAVNPSCQRAGVGRAILQETCRRLGAACMRAVYLEVRPSNAPALALYRQSGFTLASVRQAYYRDPTEDAFVLSLTLGADGAAAGQPAE